MKKITILGIHSVHDAGAAIVQNGKILAAINEERISNIKHHAGVPQKSIEEVFKIAKIHPSEIDAIAIVNIKTSKFPKPFGRYPNYSDAVLNSITSTNQNGLEYIFSYNQRFRKLDEFNEILTKIGVDVKNVIFVEHHAAHAAGAYYLSPSNLDEDVLIFTADGNGDGISSTISVGQKGRLSRIENSESNYLDSLGAFYSNIVSYLGMNWAFDPFKLMGLAPYGKSDYCIEKIKTLMDIDDTNNLKFKNKSGSLLHITSDRLLHTYTMQPKLEMLLKDQRFDNIAAATQEWFEVLITKWIKNAIEKTGIHKIACAGGNFLNVKANKKILSMSEVDDAFFCPAAGDEGLAVGAALRGYFEMAFKDGIMPSKMPLRDSYFGSSFSNEEIEESLKKNNLLEKAEFIDDIDSETGELLAKGSIVARFSGKMEWGPRGLGNRSIIANASNPSTVRTINKAIKMRDFWMPFAPSILNTRIEDYLIDAKSSPYMILSFDTTEKRNEMSAAIHPYDLTCRPQTVTSEYNPGYEKVLKSFEAKTGIGAILNTSFNLHGNPIVWSPDIAIDTFNNSDLDAIALGNYLLKKN